MRCSTLTDKQISEIELGPRQLLMFDLEDDVKAEQNRTIACLNEHIESFGTTELDSFLPEAAARTGNSEFSILQHLFWLANDLHLHFRNNGKNISPGKAKKILFQSADHEVEIVLNKSVDEQIVQSVKEICQRIMEDASILEKIDQVELARHLARQIKHWERTLESWRPLAQKPGFPGEGDIDTSLEAVRSISATLEPCSLITGFHSKRKLIAGLADKIKKLSRFYVDQSDNWQLLIQLAAEFKGTIGRHLVDATIIAAYERFNRILLSNYPYDDVNEAWLLLRTLKPFHDTIAAKQVQEYAEEQKKKIGILIQRMITHLQAHGGTQDLCNKSLYALRESIKGIDGAKSAGMIDQQVQAAEEAFETAWEEVIDQEEPS